jgi:hypothetical protein
MTTSTTAMMAMVLVFTDASCPKVACVNQRVHVNGAPDAVE